MKKALFFAFPDDEDCWDLSSRRRRKLTSDYLKIGGLDGTFIAEEVQRRVESHSFNSRKERVVELTLSGGTYKISVTIYGEENQRVAPVWCITSIRTTNRDVCAIPGELKGLKPSSGVELFDDIGRLPESLIAAGTYAQGESRGTVEVLNVDQEVSPTGHKLVFELNGPSLQSVHDLYAAIRRKKDPLQPKVAFSN